MFVTSSVYARRVRLLAVMAMAVCLCGIGCRSSPPDAKIVPQSPVAAADASAPSRGWYYAQSKDPVKGTEMRVAELHDQWQSSKPQTPAVLKVFHAGKTYAVSVKVPGIQMDDPPLITCHFDGGDPVHETWLRSDDGDAAFSPAPLAFLKRLSATQIIAIEYVPLHGLPTTVSFHASGFSTDGFIGGEGVARAPGRRHGGGHRRRHRARAHVDGY